MIRNEIRLMEAAIVLAEELNFSRAADRLHITQPGLTKQIAELESRLGFPLFERNHQTVEVTDAGRAFVEEARLSVLHGERAVQAARAVIGNAEFVLRIGRSPYTDPFFTSALLSIRLPLFPRLRLDLSSGFSCDLVRDVLAGKIDMAIANEPPHSPLLSMTKIADSPFYVAMSEDHELASQRSVHLGELDKENWVVFGRSMHPPLYDSIMRVTEAHQVSPRELHHIMVPEEAYQPVAENGGLALLTKTGALRIARDGVTIRPLVAEELMMKTYLACRANDESKITSEMVRAFGRKMRGIKGDAQLNLPISA
jgi:DNA-binding transcriptional LysR family regulator